jgi:hypothetical protein
MEENWERHCHRSTPTIRLTLHLYDTSHPHRDQRNKEGGDDDMKEKEEGADHHIKDSEGGDDQDGIGK